jgi:hypothetical protein
LKIFFARRLTVSLARNFLLCSEQSHFHVGKFHIVANNINAARAEIVCGRDNCGFGSYGAAVAVPEKRYVSVYRQSHAPESERRHSRRKIGNGEQHSALNGIDSVQMVVSNRNLAFGIAFSALNNLNATHFHKTVGVEEFSAHFKK